MGVQRGDAFAPLDFGTFYYIFYRLAFNSESCETSRDVKYVKTLILLTRKFGLFGHICRMENDRKIKSLVF